MKSYYRTIFPVSSTIDIAGEALKSQLIPIFNTGTLDQSTQLELVFKSFALTVGAGMAPAFIATPPISLIGFSILFAAPSSSELAAANFANSIHLWSISGTATNSVSGASVNWN